MLKIRFFSLIRMELGISEVEVDPVNDKLLDSLQQAESQIGKRFLKKLINKDKQVKKGTIILLNGRNIVHLDGLNSEVKAGDEIAIFPPGGGG